MKDLVFTVFTLIAMSVKAQVPAPGAVNKIMQTQENQLMAGQDIRPNQGLQMTSSQGPQMPGQVNLIPGQGIMPNKGLQMTSSQGPQMPGPVNLLSAVMGTQGLMPEHMGSIYNQPYPQRNNRFSSNYMSQTGAFGNQQGPHQGDQSAMFLMPFVFGGDKGRRFAMMNMMMNPKQGMNSMAPWLLMDGGMDGAMWPLMAMTNNRRSKINPLMIMAADGMM